MPKQIKLKDVVGGLEEVAECTVGGHTKDNCVKCAKAYANNSLLEKEVEIDEEALENCIYRAETRGYFSVKAITKAIKSGKIIKLK